MPLGTGRCALATALVAALALGAACSQPPGEVADGSSLTSKITTAVDPYVGAEDSVRAVLALVDGEVVYEQYYRSSRQEYRDVFSVTKSVMSTLVGIAISEGDISGLDATLEQLLPRYASDMSARVAGTTLRELLTMTGGFAGLGHDLGWNFQREQEPVRRILRDSVVARSGQQFIYSDVGAHLISPILEIATGTEVVDYARSRLFDPLGIPSDSMQEPIVFPDDQDAFNEADFAWPVDRDDYNLGYAHLKLRPVDMATLGQLYLQMGKWEDQQLVSASWIREATSDQTPHMHASLEGSYGYFWWTLDLQGASAFAAVGLGGQRVQVVPEMNLVIVVSTDLDVRDPEDQGITDTHATQIADAVISAVAG